MIDVSRKHKGKNGEMSRNKMERMERRVGIRRNEWERELHGEHFILGQTFTHTQHKTHTLTHTAIHCLMPVCFAFVCVCVYVIMHQFPFS